MRDVLKVQIRNIYRQIDKLKLLTFEDVLKVNEFQEQFFFASILPENEKIFAKFNSIY